MTRYFVRHPVTTWMIFTAFVVLGIYALPKLKIEALPEVDLPTLTIQTQWNGASPQAIQRSITLPIEESVGRVHGVEKVVSTSRSGQSQVEVSFRRDVDIDFARVELNEQLGAVRRDLPLNASQPQLLPYVPEEFESEDFFTFSMESELSPNDLREMAETWIKPQLLALEGVADSRVMGGARSLYKVILDRDRLELYNITADEVFASLDQLDELRGAGVIYEDGLEKLVALRDRVDINRLSQAEVARRMGTTYRLYMLGKVIPDFEDPQYFVRANGNNVVQIAVEKRSGANTVSVSNTLKAGLPAIEASLPFEASFHIDNDQGEELREKLVELVYRSLAILAILFILLAISLRQIRLTSIVIASILFAIVISLSLFYFFKLSVNFITISGLTVCFGLILDNSILVLDSIHRRLEALEKAEDAKLSRKAKLKVAIEMIVAGTHEVVFPILTTTLTTIVAFLSFIFLSGRFALFYVPLAVSVATAMIASLFVAFGWIPVALNQGWAQSLVKKTPDGPNELDGNHQLLSIVEEVPDLESKRGWLERAFDRSQRLWWVLLPPIIGLVVWGFVDVYPNKVIKGGFWQMPDMEELLLYLEMPGGTDVILTAEQLAKFEEELLPIPDGARMTSTTFGNQAILRVEFDEALKKTEYPTKYRLSLVEVADATGGASIFIRGFSDRPYFKGPFSGSALNSLIKMTGYNSRTLNEMAEDTLDNIGKSRRVRKERVTSGRRFDRSFQDETVLTIDREALAEHNLSVIELVGYVRRLLGVDTPWTMLVEGKRQRMQLAFNDSETIQYSDVASKTITNAYGEKVKLIDLVTLEQQPVKGSITRENQRYTMFLNWEYVGTDKMRRNYIKNTVDGIEKPYGYTVEEATQQFFTEEEEADLKLTLILAVAFIFMIMAGLFESVSLPILVLLSLPLAMIGVFLAFWWTDSSFDSSARIGLVLLFGIVVNNAILLVSRFRQEAAMILKAKLGGDPESEAALFAGMRKQLGGSNLRMLPGSERADLLRRAVARGTRIRLRSILLTSSTTIVGLAPLLIKFGDAEGQDIWENLALSSIGGLVSSTILILLFLPPLYYFSIRFLWVMERFGRWLKKPFQRKKTPESEPVQA